MSCLVKVQFTPAPPTETAHSAAVTPTGPPANSRKRRLLLSTPRDGTDLSVGAAEANGGPAGGAIAREEETAT